MRRQAISVIGILIGIVLIVSLSRDVQRLLSTRDRMVKEYSDVLQLEQEQQDLAIELNYVVSDEFVEQEARDKLLLAKPGEVVIILPPYEESTATSDLVFEPLERNQDRSNWRKWVELFF